MDNYNDLLEASDIEKIKVRVRGIKGIQEVEFVSATRLDKNTLPKGYHAYETRHADNDWATPISIAKEGDKVLVNYCGTIITKKKLSINQETTLTFLGYIED